MVQVVTKREGVLQQQQLVIWEWTCRRVGCGRTERLPQHRPWFQGYEFFSFFFFFSFSSLFNLPPLFIVLLQI